MKDFRLFQWSLTMGVAVVVVSCGQERGPEPTGSSTDGTAASSGAVTNAESVTHYAAKGVVAEVLKDRNRIRIAHEEIPGYMGAMTMVFKVQDPTSLEGLENGDSVEFRMVVTKTDGWIDNLVKVGKAPPAASPVDDPTFRRVKDVDPLNVGDIVPEYHFTNELGQAVSLSQFKGNAVALTFLFTRCPFPTFCPRMAANFVGAQEKLKALEGGPDNWRLLALTVDPEFDTPEILKAYGEGFDYDPNRWSFLTGALIDITAIAEQFEMLFWRPDPSQPSNIQHNLRTVVIDTQGRVRKIFPENEWQVDELVAELAAAAKP